MKYRGENEFNKVTPLFNRARELVAGGMSMKAACREVGMSHYTYFQRQKKLKLRAKYADIKWP